MKVIAVAILTMLSLISFVASAQLDANDITGGEKQNLYLDVHKLPPGKINLDEVAGAHAKDLAVEGKYGVKLHKYWVDVKGGNIYCLASASDSSALRKTHAEAHGLLPDQIFTVTPGEEASPKGGKQLLLDVHEFGPGKVSAKDVAEAHKRDLAVQKKYGVNLINYWVDEKAGVVMCLAEAKNPKSLEETHKVAHGLMPTSIHKVVERK
jgi:hypothetical protein